MESPIPGVDIDRVIAELRELGIRVGVGTVQEAWMIIQASRDAQPLSEESRAWARRVVATGFAREGGPALAFAQDDALPETLERALVLSIQLRRALSKQSDGFDGQEMMIAEGGIAAVTVELAFRFVAVGRIAIFIRPTGTNVGCTTTRESEEDWLDAERAKVASQAGLLPHDVRILAAFECNGPATRTR